MSMWPAAFQVKSVRTRLILWNTVSLVLILVVLGLTIHYFVSAKMYANVDRELVMRTGPMDGGPPDGGKFGPRGRDDQGGPNGKNNGQGGPDGGFGPADKPNDERALFERLLPKEHPRPRFNSRAGNPSTTRGIVFDKTGKSIMDDVKVGPVSIASFRAALNGTPTLVTAIVDDEPYRYYYKRVADPFEGVAVLQAPYPLSDVKNAIAELDRGMLLLLPFVLICAFVFGNAMTKSILKPVRKMTHSAESFGAEDLSKRLPASGSDEFSELASTFNRLLERLETAFNDQRQLVERQRRFTADASHELRTPLTIIKANTSLTLQSPPDQQAYRETIEDIDKAVDSMNRLVANLLTLARADEQQLGQNSIELSLSEVIEGAIQVSKKPDGPKIVQDETIKPVIIKGNQDELVRLFANLIDNAQRYTPLEGSITISAREEGPKVAVSVRDTGSGISPEHLPHLLERFYRADSSRTRSEGGTGLGLSICQSIVDAHAGSIRIDSVLGEGTTVVCTFPKVDMPD